MVAAYLRDTLVEDFFQKYSKFDNRSNNSLVDSRAFSDAVRDLGLKWNNNDIDQVFGWISDAFNSRDGL
jgi:hypothetical protein